MQSLTGAQPLNSLSAGLTTPSSSLGKLKEVSELTVLGETYLQLEGASDEHCSIILTSHLTTVVEEMTTLCRDTGKLIKHHGSVINDVLFDKITFFFLVCSVYLGADAEVPICVLWRWLYGGHHCSSPQEEGECSSPRARTM